MANLDAPALKMELTPEAAIGIAQKEVAKRGWKKFDLSDIVTVYVPFYVFSFDVVTEGGSPPGKAALNANTGELNEFIPALLERPLKRERKTPAGMDVDVEPTNIRESEVEKVATVKIANTLGAKRENIVISAVSKIYVPFFRLWMDVADDSFKIEIDCCLGYPSGLDAIPKRQKGWEETTSDTVQKMKSPSGLAQLASATIGEISKLATGKGDNKYVQWTVIGIVILALGFLVFQQFSAKVECAPNNEFMSKPQFFGILGAKKLQPGEVSEERLFIEGTCKFSSRENDKLIISQVIVKKGSVQVASTTVNATTQPGEPIERDFHVEWTRTEDTGEYELTVEKIVG